MSKFQVQAGDCIAVYGLLRAGQSGFEKFGLDRAFAYVGPCKLAGNIFDMGGFPGLFAAQGIVKADLFEILEPTVMAQLDAFEDFWPKRLTSCRYLRKMTPLIEPKQTQAWVYHCQLPTKNRPLVTDGDWVKWFDKNYSASEI